MVMAQLPLTALCRGHAAVRECAELGTGACAYVRSSQHLCVQSSPAHPMCSCAFIRVAAALLLLLLVLRGAEARSPRSVRIAASSAPEELAAAASPLCGWNGFDFRSDSRATALCSHACGATLSSLLRLCLLVCLLCQRVERE